MTGVALREAVDAQGRPQKPELDAQGRPLKPKTLKCSYCSRFFRRVEHVQRHERTHTKEKPFGCAWDHCGKRFGRRDLLVRHEKLVHLNEATKDASGRPRKASSGSGQTASSEEQLNSHGDIIMNDGSTGLAHTDRRSSMSQYTTRPTQMLPSMNSMPPEPAEPRMNMRTLPSHNLDLLSDAATRMASTDLSPIAPPTPYSERPRTDLGLASILSHHHQPQQQQQHQHQSQQQLPMPQTSQQQTQQQQQGQPPATSFDDYNLFFDDYSTSSNFISSTFDYEYNPLGHQRMGGMGMGGGQQGFGPRMPGSSFPSTRFSSVQPDMSINPDTGQRMSDDMGSGHGLMSNAGNNNAHANGGNGGNGGNGLAFAFPAPPPSSMLAPPRRLVAMSTADHEIIKNRLEEFKSVMPPGFVYPSRHTMSRFIEGYFTGFHDHLPFLHVPTVTPVDLSPELLLAVLAVGAHYRFETPRGNALWYAAKVVALEQHRRRHIHEMHSLLPTSAAYSPHSTRPSPSMGYRQSFSYGSVHGAQDRPMTQDTHREPYAPNTPQARLETIQALLLLFAVGLWGPKAILNETIALQSQLALLLREEGLDQVGAGAMGRPSVSSMGSMGSMGSLSSGMSASQHHNNNDWDTWIRVESTVRTKLVAFCFFNLSSMVYNTPPALVASEVDLMLPQPTDLWRAESAWQWQELRQQMQQQNILAEYPLQDTFRRMLKGSPAADEKPPLHHMSLLGSYILMHCFIQHIYQLKQAHGGVLRGDDIEEIAQGLRTWQKGFEYQRQLQLQYQVQLASQMGLPSVRPMSGSVISGIGMNNSGAPGVVSDGPELHTGGAVCYNATALFRIASLRLYTENRPSLDGKHVQEQRRLETRDAVVMGRAFYDAPLLSRTTAPGSRAPRTAGVMQAVRALAVVVRRGVNYVANTKMIEWSMQLSLCDLECALLLAKWLVTLAGVADDAVDSITAEENALLENLRRLLDETEYAVPIDPSLATPSQGANGANNTVSASESGKLRQLAVAVLQLWAETFKGSHHLFEFVRIIGQGLEQYADLLEKEGSSIGSGSGLRTPRMQ